MQHGRPQAIHLPDCIDRACQVGKWKSCQGRLPDWSVGVVHPMSFRRHGTRCSNDHSLWHLPIAKIKVRLGEQGLVRAKTIDLEMLIIIICNIT